MENKTSKYFKYAIGEIILVVIGILIALQINNWNQQRSETNKEQLLLEQLHIEFLENKVQLEKVLTKHEESFRAVNYIMSQFPIDPAKVNADSLEASRKKWAMNFTFNPSQGVIKSLVNSSSFELISNPKLRTLLVSWEDVLADYQEEEEIARDMFHNFVIPSLKDHIVFGSWADPRFDKSYFATYQFENILRIRHANIRNIIRSNDEEDKKIRDIIDQIIELSKPNTND